MLHRELCVSTDIKQMNLSFEIQILAWDKTIYVTNGGDSNSLMTRDKKNGLLTSRWLAIFSGVLLIQLPLQIVRKRLRYILIKPALDFSSRTDLTCEAIIKRRFIVG